MTPREDRLARGKRRLAERLDHRNRAAADLPVLAAARMLAKKTGLVDEIDRT